MKPMSAPDYVYRPWDHSRRDRHSRGTKRMLTAIIERETSLIFDPNGEFSEIQRRVMARLARLGPSLSDDIAKPFPMMNHDNTWFALLDLTRLGYVYMASKHYYEAPRFRWNLTGCGRLFLQNPPQTS